MYSSASTDAGKTDSRDGHDTASPAPNLAQGNGAGRRIGPCRADGKTIPWRGKHGTRHLGAAGRTRLQRPFPGPRPIGPGGGRDRQRHHERRPARGRHPGRPDAVPGGRRRVAGQ
ncbi:MAG: hypothetical protein VR70_18230 [Rhodospirillaceae bacterium BRH_c57]|nr:MAG: hypothetical protein VR70_18230 [Rhodospirillaceae bacterium BRH_c57]